MWQNVYRQSPHGDKEMFLIIMLAVFRILDKLHIFSNILYICSILLKCEHRSNLYAHVTAYLLFIYLKHPNKVFFTIITQYFRNKISLRVTQYFVTVKSAD